MLRILKNIKNNFIILISLFLISPVLAVGEPSSKYDGTKQFWTDVKSIIVDKKDAKSLKVYTE